MKVTPYGIVHLDPSQTDFLTKYELPLPHGFQDKANTRFFPLPTCMTAKPTDEKNT